jgi:hypothetical protein
MRGEMRRFMKLGLQALAEQGPGDVSGAVRSRAQVVAEQFSTLAAGFLEWTGEARASLLQELKDLVTRQVEEMGVAMKKDLDDLKARLDRLEAAVGDRARSGGGAGRTGAPSRGKAKTRAKSSERATSSSSSRSARSKAASSSSKRSGSRRTRASRRPG